MTAQVDANEAFTLNVAVSADFGGCDNHIVCSDTLWKISLGFNSGADPKTHTATIDGIGHDGN